MESINYIAILVAGIAPLVIGSLWYGPIFGKIWIKEAGFTPEMMAQGKEKGMKKSYAITFIFSLVSAYALYYLMSVQSVATISSAITLASLIWLGFQLPIHLSTVLWDTKSFKLFVIYSLHSLVALWVTGIILVLIS
ncbi:MAG: hypothetical protein A3E93_01235 [Candidatus Zambryskibacteria bacterium RIFCSPHIGHO2_12_FULL_43_12b]|uniref:DUF1761 domain-containing protein n=1 Tax=Candidatus Zambryskibacteria bacterium RIFCSPLOWO2_01_FULL_43_17 TaxID=1802760 RepID=A0A1G2U439_9BACT|nr:MAG: hypothetical protein A3E93_01235 [Candidatus Zambryskibacteria bacterium RIFCSPHIGHO2_12_FULL_43_12b]OHB04274.1 MAG: hypothetical protein A2920_01015 [Candidatus Zambryskibacteria bacterium RIFCSPLOWO2_01_FULL_43_17]